MGAEADWLDSVLEPTTEDSADVRWALETAVALWARGDKPQAVRWMQHAAQAATADGRQDRAGMLDRAAVELEARQAPARSMAVPSVTQPDGEHTEPIHERRTPVSMTNRSPRTTGTRRRNLPPTAPYKVAPEDVTRLVAPDSSLLEACEAEEPMTHREPPKSRQPTVSVPLAEMKELSPPSIPIDSLDATLTRVRPAVQDSDGVEHTVVMDSEEPAPERISSTGSHAPSTLGSPTTALESMRALRVVVAGGSGKELVVRLLDEGEPVPDGAQEALLIALGPARNRA